MAILGAFFVPHPPLLIPQIGQGAEVEVANTVRAYHTVCEQIANLSPQTICLISPHSEESSDSFTVITGKGGRGDMSAFSAPTVVFKKRYDTAFSTALIKSVSDAGVSVSACGGDEYPIDHGAIVPLYFLESHFTEYELVRISVSNLPLSDHYRVGQAITRTAELMNRNIVVIASGDLSHRLGKGSPYGFREEGPVFDRQITKALAGGDFRSVLEMDEELADAAGECGLKPLLVLSGTLDQRSVASVLLSYEAPYGVGYAVSAYLPGDTDRDRSFLQYAEQKRRERVSVLRAKEDEYLQLARAALETYILERRSLPVSPALPQEMTDRAGGVFVSIYSKGSLRGCVGTVTPSTANIAEEIIANAIRCGTEDSRFAPVSAAELDGLLFRVDILCQPERILDPSVLDVQRYGIIVSCDHRRGLLLPNLKGVDTPEQQIAIALQKAGIKASEDYSLERFEVVRHA